MYEGCSGQLLFFRRVYLVFLEERGGWGEDGEGGEEMEKVGRRWMEIEGIEGGGKKGRKE